ncbi:MAG: transcription termination factor NusA [Candidatus Magasanikbacteria bacterium]|nr:transcription termination factor NusA [Candidatus Magasanikbacteria bacterium]
MPSEITKAIQTLCEEKALSVDVVMETIEAALAAAYRKDFGNKQQNIKVKFDPETGDTLAWDVKTVVEDIDAEVLEKAQEELTARREKAREEGREMTEEEVADLPRFNPKTEMMKSEAKAINKKAKIGEILEIPLEIQHDFGRMAAQTAKQVIIQKIREAERNMVYGSYKDQEGKIIIGTVQRVEGRKVLVDLGKVTAIMPSDQQTSREFYRPGSRMKFFVAAVNMTVRGPEIVLSRNSTGMVEEIFHQEIPEIGDGSIQVKGIARDAGFRSKVAVYTEDNSIDPIGSCIGQRGGRINTIIEELGGEKIDVIKWNEDPAAYIGNALSPAKVLRVEINNEYKEAEVYVAADQFSLAIGRNGQNVRLASTLTGWKIKVKEEGGTQVVSSEEIAEEVPVEGAVVSEAPAEENPVAEEPKAEIKE